MADFLIIGDSPHISLTTNHPTSGYYYNADSTPCFYVFEEDTDNAIITGSFTQRTGKPGLYRATFDATTGNGFETGKTYHVIASGIVAGVPSFHNVKQYFCVSGDPITGVIGFNPDQLWAQYANRTITGNVTVGAINNDVITNSSLATTAVNEIVDGVWNALRSDHQVNGSFGQFVPSSGLNEFAVGGSAPTAAQVADAVWDELRSDHVVDGSFGQFVRASGLNEYGTQNANLLTWLGLTPLALGGGGHVQSSGALYVNSIGANQFQQAAADKVWSTSSRTVQDVINTLDVNVLSIDTGPRDGIAGAVWDQLRSDHQITGSFGQFVRSSGLAEYGGGGSLTAADVWTYTGPRALSVPVAASGGNVNVVTMANNTVDAAQFTQSAADKVWSTAARTITGGTVTTVTNPVSVNSIADDTITEDTIRLSTFAQIGSGVWNYSMPRGLNVPVTASGITTVDIWNFPSRQITGGTVDTVSLTVSANVVSLNDDVITEDKLRLSTFAQISSGVWNHTNPRSLSVPVSASGGNVNVISLANDSITANVIDSTADTEIAASVWNALRSDYQVNGSFGQFVRSSGLAEYTGSSLTASDVWTFSGPRALSVPVAVSGGNVHVVSMANNVVDANQFTQSAADKVWSTVTRTITGGTVTTVTNPVSVNSIADDVITHDVLSLSAQAQLASGVWNFTNPRSLSVPVSASGGNVNVVSLASDSINNTVLATSAADEIATSVWTHTNPRSLSVPVATSGGNVNVISLANDSVNSSVLATNASDEIAASVWTYTNPRGLTVPVAASGGNVNVVSMAANTVDASQFTQSAADKVWSTVSRTITGGTVTNVTNNVNAIVVSMNDDVITPDTINLAAQAQLASGVWNFTMPRGLSVPVAASGGNVNVVTLASDSINNTVLATSAADEIATSVWTHTSPRSLSVPVAASGGNVHVISLATDSINNTVLATNAADEIAASVWGYTSPRSLSVPVAASGGNINVVTISTSAANSLVDNVWDELRSDHVVNGSFGQFVRSSGLSEYSGASLTAADVWAYGGGRTVTGGTVDTITNIVNANVEQWRTVVPSGLIRGYVITSGIQEFGAAGALTAADVWTYTGPRALSVPVAASGGNVNVVSMANNVVDASQFTQSAADKVWSTASRTITGGTITTVTNNVNSVVVSMNDDVITHDVLSLSAQAQIGSGVWNFTNPRSITVPVSASGGNVNVDGWRGSTPLSLISGFVRSSGIEELLTTPTSVWNAATRTLTGAVTVTGTPDVNVSTWRGGTPNNLNNGYIASSGINEFGPVIFTTANQTLVNNLVNLDTTISSRATDAGVWTNSSRSLTLPVSVSGVPTVNLIEWRGIQPNNLNSGNVSSSGLNEFLTNIYFADIQFTKDNTNNQDEYTVFWFKNAVPVNSITSPTIQVIKRVDGTDLIASTSMTQIGSSSVYKYDATGASRTTAGEAVVVIVTATIDGVSRTMQKIVSRDSSS